MTGGECQDDQVFPFGRAAKANRPDSPEALLKRSARGDQRAFAAFYDLVSARVFGVIRSVVCDPARSEEVTQEVMLELWRTAPRYSVDRGTALGWALTIAHRRAVDCVRSTESSRRRESRIASEVSPVDSNDPAVITEVRLDAARVSRALNALTESQRESVSLAYFQGYSHSEVASVLDLPLGTVKTRIRDGLIRLRDEMGVER